MNTKQHGFSLISVIFYLSIITVSLYYGSQLFAGYMEKSTTEGIIENVIKEAQVSHKTSRDIQEDILRGLDMNNINRVKAEDIDIFYIDNRFQIIVYYTREIPITDNVSIFMNYKLEK